MRCASSFYYIVLKENFMEWSKYNFLFEDSNNFFLYNSLSNSFAELSKETFGFIRTNRNNIEILGKDKELFDNLCLMKAIVKSDKDEYDKIKFYALAERFNNRRLDLTINPTLACNFACPYCFEEDHRNIYMSENTENEIIEFIKQYKSITNINVTWFGGEPLLAFSRIESLTKKIIELGINYKAGIISNGYLLNKEIASNFESLHINSIQITLDGLADIHDSRRRLKSGGRTFDKILSNIGILNEISPQTKVLIRVNIDKTNMDDFVDLYKLIQSKQYHNTYISPAFVDDISQQNMNPCIFNQTDKAEFIKGLLIKYNLDFSLLYPSSSRHECAVRNPFSVVIGPEGELYKCWNDVGNKNRIYGYLNGTITNESVLLDYLMRADPFEDKKCRRCKFIPVCSGGCPYNRLAIMKNSSKETSCLIQKNYLKTFLSLHYNSKKSID